MSHKIPENFIQDVLARTDIVEIVEPRVALRKQGRDFAARCPFHDEKSPSFTVSPQKQFYYCFGCGAHGNAIGFLMAFERLSFPDAVETLASKLGLTIPTEALSPAESSTHKNDLTVLESVTDLYEQALKKSPEAISYLKSRGMTGKTAKSFRLGYASPNGLPKSFTAPQIEALARQGLWIQKENHRGFDRFRHRVMFPIRNTQGKVIGFGGRVLSANDQPKYMNSPETPLFHKSQELYGLYEALQAHKSLKRIIIVEGYMDVIMLHQYGLTETVATLGTAFHARHLQTLFRYTEHIIFCFDGDNAGRNAAWKSLLTTLPHCRDGLKIEFLFLPPEEDPDTLMRRIGLPGFEQRLTRAMPLSEFFFNHLKEECPADSVDARTQLAAKAKQHLETMPKGLYRELLYQQLADRLHLYQPHLDALIATQKTAPKKPQTLKPRSLLERAIALLLQDPQLVHNIPVELVDTGLFDDSPFNALFRWLYQQLTSDPKQTAGQLLESLHHSEHRAQLAELAALPALDLSDSRQAELRDLVSQLMKQHQNSLVERLIHKSKQAELSAEEKNQLQALLLQ